MQQNTQLHFKLLLLHPPCNASEVNLSFKWSRSFVLMDFNIFKLYSLMLITGAKTVHWTLKTAIKCHVITANINMWPTATEGECPVLDEIFNTCQTAEHLVGDHGQLFLPLCSLHQICYLCVSTIVEILLESIWANLFLITCYKKDKESSHHSNL